MDETPPPSERDKLFHNERIKLSATLLNGIALAFIVGGGVTTFTGIGGLPALNDLISRALVWVVTGAIVHVLARATLGKLL